MSLPKIKKIIPLLSGLAVSLLIYSVYNYISKPIVKSSAVPANYDECARSSRSAFNQVTCSIAYGDREPEAKECLALGGCNPGASDGLAGCRITFINPEFKFPASYDQCLAMQKGRGFDVSLSINEAKKMCSFYLNPACYRDQKLITKFISSCPGDFAVANQHGITTCRKEFTNQ